MNVEYSQTLFQWFYHSIEQLCPHERFMDTSSSVKDLKGLARLDSNSYLPLKESQLRVISPLRCVECTADTS
jgi:hypothetical protein